MGDRGKMTLTFIDIGFIVHRFVINRGKGNVNTLVVRRLRKWRPRRETSKKREGARKRFIRIIKHLGFELMLGDRVSDADTRRPVEIARKCVREFSWG